MKPVSQATTVAIEQCEQGSRAPPSSGHLHQQVQDALGLREVERQPLGPELELRRVVLREFVLVPVLHGHHVGQQPI